MDSIRLDIPQPERGDFVQLVLTFQLPFDDIKPITTLHYMLTNQGLQTSMPSPPDIVQIYNQLAAVWYDNNLPLAFREFDGTESLKDLKFSLEALVRSVGKAIEKKERDDA